MKKKHQRLDIPAAPPNLREENPPGTIRQAVRHDINQVGHIECWRRVTAHQ